MYMDEFDFSSEDEIMEDVMEDLVYPNNDESNILPRLQETNTFFSQFLSNNSMDANNNYRQNTSFKRFIDEDTVEPSTDKRRRVQPSLSRRKTYTFEDQSKLSGLQPTPPSLKRNMDLHSHSMNDSTSRRYKNSKQNMHRSKYFANPKETFTFDPQVASKRDRDYDDVDQQNAKRFQRYDDRYPMNNSTFANNFQPRSDSRSNFQSNQKGNTEADHFYLYNTKGINPMFP